MNDQAIEQEIQAKGLTAPRVTPADIEANIADEVYFTAFEGASGASDARGALFIGNHDINTPLMLLTFCVLVLSNGFTVTGESACASPENFDAELGRKIARENAINKVWPLMGYVLKQALYQAENMPPSLGSAHVGYSTMQPHQQRVVDEKAELDERTHKLGGVLRHRRLQHPGFGRAAAPARPARGDEDLLGHSRRAHRRVLTTTSPATAGRQRHGRD